MSGLRPWLLPAILGGAMSSIYFLPKVGEVADSAVKMQLPGSSGSWILRSFPPSEAEIKTLGPDTKFSKAQCLSARPGEVDDLGYSIPDQIQLSIVLSGYDLNNSIHRPERCMPAQGHQITASNDVVLKLSNKREFAAKRLLSVQRIPTGKEPTDFGEFKCITYYFFVGHDRVTNDHLKRTFIDMKDRLVRGMDQRWAYASVSMWYGDKVPMIEQAVSEEEADAKLRSFLTDFCERQINWDQVRP
ncbi:exosortase-associated EpsI family protein [bacterium]|nr:exosortase-associated EpsI family protein [bacterium]